MITNILHITGHQPRRLALGLLLAAVMLAGLQAGCQQPQKAQSDNILGPFDVLGLMRKPMRVGETTFELTPPPLILPKRELFRTSMAEYLKQPVQYELITPHQIRVHLGSGRMSFAILRPHEFPEVAAGKTCEVLGVAVNNAGQSYRQGLLIVPPNSPVQNVTEIKGLRFHFMPRGDLLNDAAVGSLVEAGISVNDVDKSLFGLGLDTYHISSLEVAKSVVLEGKAAGVIDEADYQKWPEKGGSFVLLSPSKDQVRVIAKTLRIPESPFVASNQIEPELRAQVKDFLFKVAPDKYKLALAAMDVKGFAPPIDPKEYQPFADLYSKIHPHPESHATMPAADAATPANP